MTDLEELFRPLIDESAAHREPVAAIEARGRARRVRRRRQRAVSRFGAGWVAVALVATAVGVVHARGDHGTVRPGQVATTTSPPSTVATPTGWHTFDYGLARISIPPDWTTTTGCPGPRTLLMVDPTNDGPACGAGGSPSIEIMPIDRNFVFHPSDPPLNVNGIPYEVGAPSCLAQGDPSESCPTLVWAPRLGVELSFNGIDFETIVPTLTFSTYARVEQQPFGAVPASWKTVTYDGFSVRVPADWPTVDLGRAEGFCEPAANTLYIGTPQPAGGPCTFVPARVSSPEASLRLESSNTSSPPTEAGGWHHNGLVFTRQDGSVSTPLSTELFLAVDGSHGRLLLSLGLGLDPAVARGILGSIKLDS